MDTIYKVFVEDKLIQSFKDSYWYDTATPFQWCVSEIKKIADKIKAGQEVRIISEESELQNANLAQCNLTGKSFEITYVSYTERWTQ